MNLRIVLCTIALLYSYNVIAAIEHSQVIRLNEDNWRAVLENEWMIEFYAPWCPACKNLAPAWEKLASWSNDLNIKTAHVDVTDSPALSGRFLVTALPTIFHVINGEFRQYRGTRDANSLMTFIEEQKWKEIEPVSSWKDPDSLQMAVVSYFFKLSHYLKEVNNVMLIDYGLPPWVTYVLFAIATILLGALLGLVLVSVIDLIFPPVPHNSRKSFTQAQANVGSTDEDARDELEDDGEGGDDNDDDGEPPSTSDGEKFSASDSEDVNEEENVKPKETTTKGDVKKHSSPKSSPEVRKRKPRKAD